jgi:ATP-binding cassette subfamily B protein
MPEPEPQTEQPKNLSWTRLILIGIWAEWRSVVRRIRGQRLGEVAEHDWRDSGAGNSNVDGREGLRGTGPESTSSISSRIRAWMHRRIERETTMASSELVQFRRRRVGWDELVEGELLRRIWAYFRPHKWWIFVLLIHVTLAVAIGVLRPWLAKIILDEGVLAKDTTVVMLCIGALLAASLFEGLNMRAYQRRSYSMGHEVIRTFRTDCNNAIERLHPREFTVVEPQQAATLTQENVAAVLQLLNANVLRTVVGLAVSIVLLCVLVAVDWRLAILGALALPANMVLQLRYRWRFRRGWHRVNEYYYHIKELVSERFEHHEIFRAFGVHKQAARDTDGFIDENRNASIARDWVMADWNFYVELTGHLCNVSIMAMTGWMAAKGEITPGTFMMLVVISTQLYRPILDAYGLLMNIQGAMARISDTMDFIDREKEPVHEPMPPDRHPKRLGGEIEVVDLNFRYVPDVPILEQVNIHVKPGEHVGLIGRTGSGKTTLFRLIVREYEPDSGNILFDGHDYRDLDIDWFRSQIAVVLQDAHIINSRIGAIIRLARPEASVEEVIEAAKLAEAHDFISKLPDGYNTLVGPHGIKLSGGERQRLAIARAALRDPGILVLDEATSSLDNITEAKIQRALERIMEDRTTLVISHRWTTLRNCDRIYCVLDNGQVIDVGTYDELLKTAEVHGEQLYRQLTAQFDEAAPTP